MVLGDREFCSVKLGHWLRQQDVDFCLRLRRDEYVEREPGLWVEIAALGLQPGQSLYLEGVKVTKQKGFGGFNVAAKWKRLYGDVATDEGWFLLTTLPSLPQAVAAYQKRFDIEEMFRDWKGGGYHLAGTGLTDERLISLLVVMTLAYASATLQGQHRKRQGLQPYIGRVQERGHPYRRHSSFYIGLYGDTWVHDSADDAALIRELMRLNRNKWTYYQKGLRAMELIRQAF